MSKQGRLAAVIFNKFWTIEDCHRNRHCLFVFGDNLLNYGKRGQAIIRDQPNTIGIPTKKRPGLQEGDFFTDNEYDQNIAIMEERKVQIINLVRSGCYDYLVLPSSGWGTGLARLDEKAPRTYEYCKLVFDELVELVV